MRTGVRVDDRATAKAVESLERRIQALEQGKASINIGFFAQKPDSTYDEEILQDLIDKVNEIIRKLR